MFQAAGTGIDACLFDNLRTQPLPCRAQSIRSLVAIAAFDGIPFAQTLVKTGPLPCMQRSVRVDHGTLDHPWNLFLRLLWCSCRNGVGCPGNPPQMLRMLCVSINRGPVFWCTAQGPRTGFVTEVAWALDLVLRTYLAPRPMGGGNQPRHDSL